MADYGEPWRIILNKSPDGYNPRPDYCVLTSGDEAAIDAQECALGHLRHAVACVNALRGLDPAAVARVVEAARKLRERMIACDKHGEFYAAEEVVLAVEALDA